MNEDAMKPVEQYLERVRIYLPLSSEEALTEIRTHLIEEAEAIGAGSVSVDSVLAAISRLGDPKAVANDYAGTGKRLWHVPVEYVQPIVRILVVLVAIGMSFILGASIVGPSLGDIIGETIIPRNNPANIPIMVIVNLLFVLAIMRGLPSSDVEKDPTERTPLEKFFGIGLERFRLKGRREATIELVAGIGLGVFLLLPQMQGLYTSAFKPFVVVAAALLFIGAVKGSLFIVAGENDFNLIFEAIHSGLWVFFALVLINVGWPLEYVYGHVDGSWVLIDPRGFTPGAGMPFFSLELFWSFVVFIVVVANAWRAIVSVVKVLMYRVHVARTM